MQAVFLGKELMGHVDGSVPKPGNTNPADLSEWIKKDSQAFSLLCQAIDKKYLKNVSSCTTSNGIWTKLKLLHERNASENIHALQQSFYKCQLGSDGNIAAYLGDIDVIITQLTSRGDQTFNDNAVIAKILCNLPASYDHFLSNWSIMPAVDKTLDNLTLHLLTIEERLKSRVEAEAATAAAFVASSKGKSGSNPTSEYTTAERAARRKEINDRKLITECWACGKTGHWGRECQASAEEKKAHQEAKKSLKESGRGKAAASTSSTDTYKAYMANTVLSIPCESTYWFVDSGCTEHMCQDRTAFSTFTDILHECRHVQGIGGAMLQVHGIGDVIIKIQGTPEITHGILKGVIYVPDLGRNLFSTYVAAQRKMYTLHTDTGCQLLQDGKVVMQGAVHCRLYRMLFEVVKPTDTSTALTASSFGTASKTASKQSLDTWHRRLAHVSHSTIRTMVSRCMVDGIILDNGRHTFCSGCAYGKQHWNPFPTNEPRTKAQLPGDLIHTDLCGPLPIASVGGSLYFALFKDDSTGYRVIHCIKTKPDSLRCFKLFCAQLHRETGNTVKVVRSDRGSEYVSREFRAYLDEKEIAQDLTTVYTPEQNGAAERDNRTILEAARSMLFAANIHERFWGEASNTAVYILNRTATRTLDGVTPYEAWHKVKPSVSHIRIFGCDAYVHVPKELRHKLSRKSKKGVLVGYSTTSKAYRIWHQDTRTIVESRDVLFDEDGSPDPTADGATHERIWLDDNSCNLGQIAPSPPVNIRQPVGAVFPPPAVAAPAPIAYLPQPEELSSPLRLSLPDSNSNDPDDVEPGTQNSNGDDVSKGH